MPGTTARLRHLLTSPTKVRPVLKLIAGQDVDSARDTLRLCERGVARELGKLLDSAVANAEHNDHITEDELFVSRAYADEGPTLKRWRPRARGRGVRIRKRTSHITIELERFEGEVLERRRSAGVVPRGRPRPTRRPVAEDHDHDDEHDHDHDHEDERPAKKAAPVKKTTKKATKKSTTKKATTKKSATKKATKKSTTKKSTRKRKGT